MTPIQMLVLAILDNALSYEWSVQGFGMLRLYIRNVGRLHIWDSSLRYPNVSMIHNHSWDLHSTVVFGRLLNTRFIEKVDDDSERYWRQRLITGYNTRHVSNTELVNLVSLPVEIYEPGSEYSQLAHEIHRTDAEDSTVTLMTRNDDAVGQADVFWSKSETWGTATPRAATKEEVQRVVGTALQRLGLGLD